ncbi:hypothetical protein GCM10010384_34830 [Streptomyces djakartensis]|uniref:CBS domain-containing protein n=1 Tax=Streptomyces djakartensis TaxID=68193 RepID=A0ABQ2ZT40_9ACTN|nr:hypothetical protein GCM10010384_34830 [Streptomyces djakartensis]
MIRVVTEATTVADAIEVLRRRASLAVTRDAAGRLTGLVTLDDLLARLMHRPRPDRGRGSEPPAHLHTARRGPRAQLAGRRTPVAAWELGADVPASGIGAQHLPGAAR